MKVLNKEANKKARMLALKSMEAIEKLRAESVAKEAELYEKYDESLETVSDRGSSKS